MPLYRTILPPEITLKIFGGVATTTPVYGYDTITLPIDKPAILTQAINPLYENLPSLHSRTSGLNPNSGSNLVHFYNYWTWFKAQNTYARNVYGFMDGAGHTYGFQMSWSTDLGNTVGGRCLLQTSNRLTLTLNPGLMFWEDGTISFGINESLAFGTQSYIPKASYEFLGSLYAQSISLSPGIKQTSGSVIPVSPNIGDEWKEVDAVTKEPIATWYWTGMNWIETEDRLLDLNVLDRPTYPPKITNSTGILIKSFHTTTTGGHSNDANNYYEYRLGNFDNANSFAVSVIAINESKTAGGRVNYSKIVNTIYTGILGLNINRVKFGTTSENPNYSGHMIIYRCVR